MPQNVLHPPLFQPGTEHSTHRPSPSAGVRLSILRIVPILLLLLFLVSCQSPEQKAQKLLDLGTRYLSDGHYENAVLSFTSMIEIDPKRVDAYIGRGQALLKMDPTSENLDGAQADFEKALELDSTQTDAWLGLSDVYMARGDEKGALDILRQGLEATGNSRIEEVLQDLKKEIYPEPADFVYENIYSNNGSTTTHGILTAYDGNHQELWIYETPEVEATQVERNTSLGRHNDRYYLSEDGTLVALDILDGTVVWKNTDSPSSPSFVFGDKAIYLIFLSSFAAISYEGTTLKRIDSIDPGAYWEGAISWAYSSISVQGDEATILVVDEAENRKLYYYMDLNTYEVSPYPVSLNQSNAPWKKAYLDYFWTLLNNMSGSGEPSAFLDYFRFALISIDQNSVPELFISGRDWATGDRICTWSDAGLEELGLSFDGLGYLPGENLFRSVYTSFDAYSEAIFTIQNGKFVQVHSGEYYEEITLDGFNTVGIQFDGRTLNSLEEYEAQRNAVYDTTRESGHGDLMTYDELLQALMNY